MSNINIIIANFIFTLIKYSKLCKIDLEFAFNVFLSEEEYEKCSILKELIDVGYYDDERKSEFMKVLTIVEKINKFDNNDKEMKNYEKKINKLKNDLIYFIDNIEEIYDCVVIPPIKNKKNIEYFK